MTRLLHIALLLAACALAALLAHHLGYHPAWGVLGVAIGEAAQRIGDRVERWSEARARWWVAVVAGQATAWAMVATFIAAAVLLSACATVPPPVTDAPTVPRSVPEAVGLAELALAPIGMACDPRDAHAQTVWCRAYQGAELEEVAARPGWGLAAVVGIAAHERGHQLDQVKGLPIRGEQAERSADAWAGCALYMLAIDAAPYLSVVKSLDAADWQVRARAVEDGARACAAQETP